MTESAVAKKLRLKSGMKAAVINAPSGYTNQLGVHVDTTVEGKPDASLDFVQIFVKSGAEVEKHVPAAVHVLKNDALLWISYPKGTSKIKTELNRDILWKAMEKYKMAGIFMVAIDDTWSAMRFRPADKVGK